IPGCQECLLYYFVRRGSAIRDEEHMICAESSSSFFLRNFDVSRGLQKAIETTSRCRRFCEEQVYAVKPAHISNPIRFEDGFSSRYRQCVESADATLGVFLMVIEVRRIESVGDCIQNAKVQLQRFLHLIKNSPNALSSHYVACHLLHFASTQK